MFIFVNRPRNPTTNRSFVGRVIVVPTVSLEIEDVTVAFGLNCETLAVTSVSISVLVLRKPVDAWRLARF